MFDKQLRLGIPFEEQIFGKRKSGLRFYIQLIFNAVFFSLYYS
jgi:hypothetical protein